MNTESIEAQMMIQSSLWDWRGRVSFATFRLESYRLIFRVSNNSPLCQRRLLHDIPKGGIRP